MNSMKALITRLEAADEGSRELDLEVGQATGALVFWCDPRDHAKGKRVSQYYTTSLDAALPGEDIRQVIKGDGYYAAFQFWKWNERGQPSHKIGEAKTEPLARRIARLKAIQAQAQTASVSPEDARQRLPEDMTHD